MNSHCLHPSTPAFRCFALIRLFTFLLLLAVGCLCRQPALAAPPTVAAPAVEPHTLFTNSIGPIPAEAAKTARTLEKEDLADTMEIEVPLAMRNYPQLLEKLGRGERPGLAALERDHLPTAKDYAAVRRWLLREGFTITRDDPHRVAIFARGPLSAVQQSLQVDLVKLTVRGKNYHAARTHPSVPKEIAGALVGINGLQPYLKPHHQMAQPAPANNDQPPFLVSEVLGAYNATNLGVSGAGQMIAILIDSMPKNSDLTNFWSANNIPQSLANIQSVNVNGSLPVDTEGEATLDVEWSSSVAPGSVVRVYVTGELSFTNIDKGLQDIVNDLPSYPNLHQLSISLGLGEKYLTGSSEMTTESQYFALMAAAGVSVFVSSGDAGSNPDDTGHNSASSPGPLQVEYESSDPNVTGVGGTNLYLDSAGNVTSETAWSGSGGGASQVFSRPSWQVGAGVPSGNKRLVPDVSLVASDATYAYFYFQGQSGGVAGTSWSSPTWAGYAALINQARANNSLSSLGLLNPKIYPLIGTNNFRDVTAGSNGAYSAGTGYDRVTGIGTPNVAVLMSTLAGTSNAAPIITSFSPTSGAPGATVVISGANLARATAVNFNGVAGTITGSSATQLTVTVPTGASTGAITVVSPSGNVTSAASFTVLPATLTNDNFASAQTISGTSGAVTGSNVGATKETGEPTHAGNAGGASVWYSWKAPQSAIYTFDTYGSSFDTLLAIYVGSSVSGLTAVAANDDAGTGVTSAISFSATAGVTYAIAVDGSNGQTGTIKLDWAINTVAPAINSFAPASGAPGTTVVISGANLTGATAVTFGSAPATSFFSTTTQVIATVPTGAVTGLITVTTANGTATSAGVFTVNTPPSNDNFASGAPISGASGTATGANVGATKETGEPVHAANSGGHSIWYTWTAPHTGNVTFNTFGSSFDTLLAAYTGSAVNALAEVAANQNAGSGITSAIAFPATAGVAYHIAVDGAGGVTGNVVLNWLSDVTAPVVTSFSPASGIPGSAVAITGSSFSSVTQVTFNGEPASYFIASDTQITATVPTYATTGPIAVANISGVSQSATAFVIDARPPNDNLANATPFVGSGFMIGTSVGATKESGEPNHAGNSGGASVWWNWMAPTTADYIISTLGSDFDTLLAVYTGATLPELISVSSNDNDPNGGLTSYVIVHAVAGTSYNIAVDGANSVSGSIALSIELAGANTLFSTGFEAAQGYSTALTLAGQNSWQSSGTGGNGVVNGYFSGQGQQAYIGSASPQSTPGRTYVWRPLNYTPRTGDKITFQTNWEIIDSTNRVYDDFAWSIYDNAGNLLFSLNLDNQSLNVFYQLNDGTGVHNTGYSFRNQTIYALTIVMDYGANRWSASIGGATVVAAQPISTTGVAQGLGDVDAYWLVSGSRAGNNAMLFDNYSVVVSNLEAPIVLRPPQPENVLAGSSAIFTVAVTGTEAFAFQWEKNGFAIPGATGATLALTNVQPSDAGQYSVNVTNGVGSVTSDGAALTVTLPQLPNLTPATPVGWSDSIVVTNTAGSTSQPSLLLSSEPLLVDWAILNAGPASAATGFQNSLYIDGVLVNTWRQATDVTPNGFASVNGYSIGYLAVGTHTLQIVADSSNQLAEYDEADNTYTKSVTVADPAGYYVITTAAVPAEGGTVSGAGVLHSGALVTLTAAPAAGYRFIGWTEQSGVASASPSYNFIANRDRVLNANFVAEASSPGGSVTIAVPTATGSYTTIHSTLNLEGAASSADQVRSVTWSNDRGGSGRASGASLWSISGVPLKPGLNTITVTEHDGAGGSASAQLLVTAAATADFSGTYAGALVLPGVTTTYSGMATFAVTAGGSFSGSVRLGGVQHVVTGRFAADGSFAAAVPASGPNLLTYRLFLTPGEHPVVIGTISTQTSTVSLVAPRGYRGGKVPFPQAGAYTFVLASEAASVGAPSGRGIGRITVSPAGHVAISARLADGSVFTEGTVVSPDAAAPLNLPDTWPLYGSLYHAAGNVAGQAALLDSAPQIFGLVDWIKPADARGGAYPAAITATLSLEGNVFTKSKVHAALRSGARQATLSSGDLKKDIVESITLGASGRSTPTGAERLAFAIDPATGFIKGSFIHPNTGKAVAIFGVASQADDTAAGYFLGPDVGGLLEIAAPTSGGN